MYNAWKDSYNIVVETGVDKNLLTTTSSIELLPTIKDHLADVTCEVSHVSYDNPVQLTATLLYVGKFFSSKSAIMYHDEVKEGGSNSFCFFKTILWTISTISGIVLAMEYSTG